jgi:hypothetical protein
MVSARRRPAARPLSGMKTLKHYFKSIPPPIDPGDVQDAMDLDTAHPLETGVSITNDVVLGETIDLTVDNDVKVCNSPSSQSRCFPFLASDVSPLLLLSSSNVPF